MRENLEKIYSKKLSLENFLKLTLNHNLLLVFRTFFKETEPGNAHFCKKIIFIMTFIDSKNLRDDVLCKNKSGEKHLSYGIRLRKLKIILSKIKVLLFFSANLK